MPESTCLHIQDHESAPIRVVDLPTGPVDLPNDFGKRVNGGFRIGLLRGRPRADQFAQLPVERAMRPRSLDDRHVVRRAPASLTTCLALVMRHRRTRSQVRQHYLFERGFEDFKCGIREWLFGAHEHGLLATGNYRRDHRCIALRPQFSSDRSDEELVNTEYVIEFAGVLHTRRRENDDVVANSCEISNGV